MKVLEKYWEIYFITLEVGCVGKGFLHRTPRLQAIKRLSAEVLNLSILEDSEDFELWLQGKQIGENIRNVYDKGLISLV